MTNNSDSDPNFHCPFVPPNVTLPTFPQQPAPSPSSNQNPRKKRTKITKNEAGTASANSPKPVSRPKYSKKPDPGAPKITRPCTECGKKFWSWKALFGHMRCHPEREWRGINPPPNYRRPLSPNKQLNDGWISVMSEDDHDVASCLLMLANGAGPSGATDVVVECDPSYRPHQENDTSNSGFGYRFECGGCKKVFGSHQALGGHRASHKNVKGCFAITKSCDAHESDDDPMGMGDMTRKEKAVEDQNKMGGLFLGQHKCNVCLRVFPSGQALGGHMRCHWEREDNVLNQVGTSSSSFITKQASALDLNAPATVENSSSSSSDTSGCSLDLRLGL